jgi:hypothetical protein
MQVISSNRTFASSRATITRRPRARRAVSSNSKTRTITNKNMDFIHHHKRGRRNESLLITRANDDDDDDSDKSKMPEMPEILKDLMKPPDASLSPPVWLAPLLGLAKESGESAQTVGYALMIITAIVPSLLFAVLGIPFALVVLIFVGTSGYTCWQATPYLQQIVDDVNAGFSSNNDDDDE